MSFPGLYSIIRETGDWSTASSSVLTSSSDENDYSDWSDDLKEVKNELSTEEMSTSSKGTAGWLQKHHILKSRRKHAEAKSMSTGDKASAKGKAKRKNAAKSESTLERTCISADGEQRTKSKVKRNNSSNRSFSSIIKKKDHQYTPKKTRNLSGWLNRGSARFSPPPRKKPDDVVPIDTSSSCCEVVDNIFDSMYFFRCLVDGVTRESQKYLPELPELPKLPELPELPQLSDYEGGGVKEESSRWLPWLTGNEDNTNISTNDPLPMELESMELEYHAYYLNRSTTAASF